MQRPHETEVTLKASHQNAEQWQCLTGVEADALAVLAHQLHLALASSPPFKNTFHIMNTVGAYAEELSAEIKKGADADLALVTHSCFEFTADLLRWVIQVGWKEQRVAGR